LMVRTGRMSLSSLRIEDPGFTASKPAIAVNGKPLKAKVESKDGILSLSLPERVELGPGDHLEIRF
jgi:hypothetical protein